MQAWSSFQYHDGMPENAPRLKSTLSAARALAQSRPLGAPLPTTGGTADDMNQRPVTVRGAQPGVPPKPRPQAPVQPRVAARGQPPTAAATAATAVAAAVAAAASTAARRREREGRDRRVVGVLIMAFVAVMSVLVVVRIRTSSRETDSRTAIQNTFERVHMRQSEYHTIFGRFATWPELRSRGVGIGPRQRVLGWSADRSHWFLSLKDTMTGVECDRTGELFDEDAAERLPVCRPAK